MVVKAEVVICTPDKLAKIVEGSLLPEAERPISERSSVHVHAEGDKIALNFEASDVAAMRAAINSYLRWVAAIIDAVETVG